MYICCYVSSAVSVKVSIYKQKTSVVNTVIMLLFVVTIKRYINLRHNQFFSTNVYC